MEKRWRLKGISRSAISNFKKEVNLHPTLCRLLIERGIHTSEAAKEFFNPALSQLHDPFQMKGMKQAVGRLQRAINQKEKILLYGDYDVDGTTCVALMHSFLSKWGANLDIYIPDRYKEGYGVSMQGVDYAIEHDISLVIAMDCGIKAINPVHVAKKANIDFIICDHHMPDKALPNAFAILDTKQVGCEYPYKELSGCGVAFKLAQGFTMKNGGDWADLETLLDLVVISIAADIVPITGENRVLAHFGLKKLMETNKPGLAALIAHAGRKTPMGISDIVFGLAPLINAAGRIGDAKDAVKVMLAKDTNEANQYVTQLAEQNKLRKAFDEQIAYEAKEMFGETLGWEELKSIVLYKEDWHKGVVGIAASRVVEEFTRPTIILTQSNGKAVGSARSVKGFDIHKAIGNCSELLDNYGGHKYAAGLTMPLENIEKFREKFERIVSQTISADSLQAQIEIQGVLQFKDITPAFMEELKRFAPFGPSNRSPIFVSENVKDNGGSKVLKETHLRLVAEQAPKQPINCIAFGLGHHYERVQSGEAFHLCYKIEENHWNGRTSLQLMVRDIKFPDEVKG